MRGQRHSSIKRISIGAGIATCLAIAVTTAGVPRQETFQSLARASLSRIDGEIQLSGLRAEVEVLRDRWGVPHIYAQNIDDLFFAQGFVQAQDRLWQMEMYRRIGEGRVSEIMGPSAFAHDKMARLVRYRGPWNDAEWRSYHPEAKRILDAFAAGVNAYIEHARDNLPVEFKLTGIRPEPWTTDIPLLRTQTALPIGDARAELQLARSVAELGVVEANRRSRPVPWNDLEVPRGLDVSIIPAAASAALGDISNSLPRPELLPQYRALTGALPSPEFGAQETSPGSNNWVVSGRLTSSSKVIVANDPHRNVANPSLRYIVHLNAPGWNMIGATEPPLPGVAIGHNGNIAWGLTIVGTDQSDVYVEEVNPANSRQVRWRGAWEPLRAVVDTIRIKGAAPRIVELLYSRHGPIFYYDSVNHRAYAMRSTTHEPGTAGYLGALRLHAAKDCREFLAAQVYYKAPTENMICGDTGGNIAWHASALSPRRSGWVGRLPVPGNGDYEWQGFRSDLPQEFNPERGWIATANHDIHPPGYQPPLFTKSGTPNTRYDRLASVLSQNNSAFTVESFKQLQHDAYSASAARDLVLFRGWTARTPDQENARKLLADWDATYRRESAAAALYSFVQRGLAPARPDSVRATTRDSVVQRALAEGLAALVDTLGANPSEWRWGRINRSAFRHSLIRAYDLPPIERPGGAGTVAAIGATYRQIIDLADLDQSVATNVPGQSGQPGSPFYGGLREMFERGEYFPLSYTRAAVEANTAHRLLLKPAR